MPQPLRSACSACRERGSYRTEQKPLIGAGGGSDEDVESSHGQLTGTWADVYALPPLQTPDYCAMRGEACCGNTLVLFLIFLFVAPMQAFVSQMTTPMTFAQTVWMGAIYSEAVTAILCLFGLMWGDPGTVKRSPETSFPMPEIVAERLRNGRSLEGVGNVNEDGRVYCIRCLVWRPDDTETHHCATCQRCVTDFDHHCGVFGRCIAGDGCGGNMGYFKTLILMGCLGCATCVSFMFVAGAGKQHTSSTQAAMQPFFFCDLPCPLLVPSPLCSAPRRCTPPEDHLSSPAPWMNSLAGKSPIHTANDKYTEALYKAMKGREYAGLYGASGAPNLAGMRMPGPMM